MYKILTKLDAHIIDLLCCPLCKGMLNIQTHQFFCNDCRSTYPLVGEPNWKIYDFRIHRPKYLITKSIEKWNEIQKQSDNHEIEVTESDNLKQYLAEIDSVREIYTSEFHITGSVLDVGGHQGRLRHYLSSEEVPTYVSVDPFIDIFGYAQKPSLQHAYPCISMPLNFLSCHAENLPFIANCYDWVHMRSVVDHFADPYLAFKETYRVLKPNGQVLIGLAIVERMASARQNIFQRISRKIRGEGVLPTLKAIAGKLPHVFLPISDDHNFRLKYKELLDLIQTTGFILEKEHWQKPPYSHVVYISARKIAFE
jgi:ubiquinone/menaquinone biosynthesis C-methylase UbiE